MDHADASAQADRLGRRLTYSLAAGWGLGFASFLAAGVVLAVSIVTFGIGFYLAAPVAGLIILPVALLNVGIVSVMYWTYGSTMVHLRAAIGARKQRTTPALRVDSDVETDAEADGGA